MTERYLRSITADYITGVVSACEGIHGSLVLLNGPLGCRFYHSYAFGKNLIRESELWGLRGELQLSDAMDDRLVRSQYFAGTPQIPGSNLRYEDYIFGTGEQLERALRDILAERRYSMTVVIQTPGTSLMGEGLESLIQKIAGEFQTPSIFVESPEFSTDSCAGYDETMARLLKQFVGEKAEKEKGRYFCQSVWILHLPAESGRRYGGNPAAFGIVRHQGKMYCRGGLYAGKFSEDSGSRSEYFVLSGTL